MQTDKLRMVPVGKVSFWVKSLPASSHRGVHLVIVMRAVGKLYTCLVYFKDEIILLQFGPSSITPFLWVTSGPAWYLCSDTWPGWLQWGKQKPWPGSGCSPCQDEYGKFMQLWRIHLPALDSRDKAEWMVRVEQKMPRTVKIHILIVSSPCGHLKLWFYCSVTLFPIPATMSCAVQKWCWSVR